MLLLDGAATVMLIHHDAAYVKAAGDLAGMLVEAASRRDLGRAAERLQGFEAQTLK
ncbi:hypothetical protein [Bradyrhizobium sp. STM 3562]|uniref:hypothetical protein n=1 Tax=Bradyrhizobium sp. STM 3562 TaxID=578924 RepID=UPI00388F9DF5